MIPSIVKQFSTNFGGWVIGSGCQENPKDWDVLIPFSEWNRAAHLIPKDAKPNTFGGWKFTVDGVDIDVWPGELSFICNQAKFTEAWCPATGRRIKRSDQ